MQNVAVGGARNSTLALTHQNVLHRPRPLHHTSCGPPPPLSRGRMQAIPFSRCIGFRKVLTRSKRFSPHRGTFISASPKRRGKRSADRRGTRELHPLPGTAEILLTRTPHLSALHCGLKGVASLPGPGQRFLESPDANGSTLA